MSSRIACAHCGAPLKLADNLLGKPVRCPHCQKIFETRAEPEVGVVPAEAVAEVLAAPPRRPARDDDREFDERPRRRQPRQAPGSAKPLIIGLTLGVLALAGLVVGGVIWLKPLLSGEIRDDSWVEFVGPDGKFRLLMPGRPMAKQQPIPNTNQQMTMHLVDLKSKVFMVTLVDIPLQEMGAMSVEQRMVEARNGMLKNSPNSKLVSEKPITFEKYPGREVVVRVQNEGNMVTHMIFVDNRMYLLLAGGNNLTADSPEVTKFFASFRLLQPAPAKAGDAVPKKSVPSANDISGLVFYRSFDEGGGDEQNLVPGIRGKAMKFDGNGTLVVRHFKEKDIGNDLIILRELPFTVAAWFKTANSVGTLMAVDQKITNDGFEIVLTQNEIRAAIGSGPTGAMTGPINVHDNMWHHYALTRNGKGEYCIHIDGKKTGTCGQGKGPLPPRLVGANFVGLMDEICVFSRELSPHEINVLAGNVPD